jgi:hypothetical protein
MADIVHALMLNQNIIDERILITLRYQSLKGEVKPLMTFLISGGS